MIATILRQAPSGRRASIAAWRQLSDILAQRGNQLDDVDIRRSLQALAVLRRDVPEHVRRDCARAIAPHGRFAPIVAFYANDVPSVSAVMLQNAKLSDKDWLALLPATGSMARSVLAARADLPRAVRRALESLGAGSVALPHPASAVGAADEAAAPTGIAAPTLASEPPASPPSQISELVRRIDKFQSARSQQGQPAGRAPRETFLFETGPDGIVRWVDGITRGAAIGLSIAEATIGNEPGADGVAAGAFRQRAEIINARMLLEGAQAEAGEWRFSALPWFDPATGQFRGYRGSARRPMRTEMPFGQSSAENSGDSIRQLIHELRSPLNAISGFAQIIAGQMFGPVNQAYRAMADAIISDAASIQSIIDDLETAARSSRIEAEAGEVAGDAINFATILDQVEAELATLLSEENVELRIVREAGAAWVRALDANARRMVGRLLTALIDICEEGSTLEGRLMLESGAKGRVQLRVERPLAIRTATAAELLDPGYSPEGEAPGAALLSLGFSLRLVDSLARAAGGRLQIEPDGLTLILPSVTSATVPDREIQNGD